MAQEIIKNLTADTIYTLPQQYTAVVGGAGIVNGNQAENLITITSGGAYLDYLMTVLFRSNTGVQFPKVHILLVDPLDATKFELVSIVSLDRMDATTLRLVISKVLKNNYATANLYTVQIDAQYSEINFQIPLYTGSIALLDQANIPLTAAVPPSFNNNAAGGPPMAIYGEAVTVAITGGGGDRTSVDPLPPSLALEWDDIGNALQTTVGDYNGVFSSDFTALSTIGNTQYLTGNSAAFEFPTDLQANVNIVKITDTANSISSIQSNAFKECSALTSVSFPVCTTAGDNAFSDCTALTSVSFPVCTSVGVGAFQACTALTSVSFPACTSVGGLAFNGCTALTSVSFPACTSVGGIAFSDCTALTSVSFPACTTVGDTALKGCTSLTTATLPLCTSVGQECFAGCTALTSVNLPLCSNLGGTVDDNFVFSSIIGNTITLTIPISRQTCDGGNPDGDIVYLAANNTATIIYV